MPAQPSVCHNTAEPTVCLFSLLYATIHSSLLCACSAFYMPQYSRAYYVPAQPSICHNTAEPTVCLLSLLYATIHYAYCNKKKKKKTQQPAPAGHNTLQCIVTHAPAIQPPKLQYNSSIAIHLPSLPHVAIQWCIAIHPQAIQALLFQYNFNSLASLQYTSYCNTKPSQPALPKPLCHNTILLSQYNWAVAQISPCTNFFFRFSHFFS